MAFEIQNLNPLCKMKSTLKLAVSVGIIYFALKAISRIRHNSRNSRRLKTVATEGYETASDVLFPEKQTKGRLHYGPVIPA